MNELKGMNFKNNKFKHLWLLLNYCLQLLFTINRMPTEKAQLEEWI